MGDGLRQGCLGVQDACLADAALLDGEAALRTLGSQRLQKRCPRFSYYGCMNYIAIYKDPYDQDGTSKDGTRITHEIRLHISSNTDLTEEQVKEMLRRHLSERFKIREIKKERIRVEQA